MTKRVLAALSGGVDSSVAAAMLVRAGYQVTGATMLLRDNATAPADARAVAQKLGIPHHVLDFRTLFRHLVLDNFVNEYSTGRTPNPCVQCNSRLKFGALLKEARQLGCTHIATGHYARIIEKQSLWHLSAAADRRKDQSYFLYRLNQDILPYVLFPLADFTGKDQVRRLAAEWELPVAEKADSQDICFIPDGDLENFLQQQNPALRRPGDIVLAASGQVIGRHRGCAFYTVGQRKGLGLSWPAPLYVLAVDATHNRLLVGGQTDLSKLRLTAGNLSFVGRQPSPGENWTITAKIRYAHNPADATLSADGHGKARVEFSQPQRAITPGQSVVFYDGPCVLGGGIIENNI